MPGDTCGVDANLVVDDQPCSGSTNRSKAGTEDEPNTEHFFCFGSLMILIGYLGSVLFCFWPAIFGQRIFVYRDAAYWYIPTLKWTTQQIADGKIPLWNDLHGLGTNWVGQGTTTVFYPATWLLAIPCFDFEQRYAAILACHVVLAGLLCFRCARSLGVGLYPAWFAAISYSLSGPILIQHANWPFLISAAWFPLAIEGLWQLVIHRRKTWVVTTAIALGLIVLGGEPQAVYLWLMVAGLLIGVRWFQSNIFTKRIRQATGDTLSIASVIVLTTLASLVQLWPMFQVSQNSTRILHSHPTNLYQALTEETPADSSPWQQVKKGLLDTAEPGSQQSQALQFSQPPWQWFTLFSGNVLGTWRQVNARWDQHLNAADRIWNPTLYAGIATFLLACSGLIRGIFCRGPKSSTIASDSCVAPARRWLSLTFFFFGLASLGWYGMGWLIIEFRNATASTQPVQPWGPQVGGLYWLLSWILPGFSQFRYPAKMWLPATLAMSLLASIELTTILNAYKRQAKKANLDTPKLQIHTTGNALNLPGITGLLALMMVTATFGISLHPIFRTWFYQSFLPAQIDHWLGKLNVDLAILEINLALFQTLTGCGLFLGWWWFFFKRTDTAANVSNPEDEQDLANSPLQSITRRRSISTGPYPGATLVCMLLFDLLIANGWLVATVDRSAISRTPSIKTAQEELATNETELSFAQQRFFYDNGLTTQHRLLEMQNKWGQYWPYQPIEKLNWQTMKSMHGTAAPQFHLTDDFAVVNPEFTLPPVGPTILQQIAFKAQATTASENRQSLWFSYLRSQGIRHWLAFPQEASAFKQSQAEQRPSSSGQVPVELITLPYTPPPIWISENWRNAPRATSADPATIAADLKLVWMVGDQFAANDSPIVLDQPWPALTTDPMNTSTSLPPDTMAAPASSVISWKFDTQSKTAIINTKRNVVVVFRQQFDPGWTCQLLYDNTGNPFQPIIPVNRFLTGVALGPGSHHIALIYRPLWFSLGGLISVLTWCGFASVWIFAWKRTRQKTLQSDTAKANKLDMK